MADVSPANSGESTRIVRSLYLPTLIVAGLAAWLAWYGWNALAPYGPIAAIRAGQLRYAGPVVLGFVTIVLLLERIWPAERRPVLARGHVLDLGYLIAYALVVMPLVTLLGAGFATLLEQHATWLILPHLRGLSGWVAILIGLLVIDATDWLVHLINHKFNPLWRLHAVHHSQEEVSVLTTFRAHPLVHMSFILTAVPGFVLAANSATPAVLMTAYACLGALPHANLRWNYGLIGRVVISPAYHRVHHRATGRLDVNLGVVFAAWDALSGRAIFPALRAPAPATGLRGRPIPVEQSDVPLAGLFLTQLIEPFTSARPAPARPTSPRSASTRRATVHTIVIAAVVATLLAGCSSSGNSANSEDQSTPPAGSPAALYLALATPANSKLDKAFDAFEDDAKDHLAKAQADLRDIVTTERAFDRGLLAMTLPPDSEATARAMVVVNESRADLTERAAASSTLDELHQFQPQLTAANDPVEDQVRLIRTQLALPPPDTD